MFVRKRFRTSVAVVLTLLLALALVVSVSAQAPPPVPPETPAPTAPIPDPPGGGAVVPPPPPTGEIPDPPAPTPTPKMDDDKMMMKPISWPPPNAIVHHMATPVQVSALPGGLSVYFITSDGMGKTGPVLASFSSLAEMHPAGGAVELWNGTSPGTGKSVYIHYLPGEKKIRISTYYADKPPHDMDKPYVFTISADHSVKHEQW